MGLGEFAAAGEEEAEGEVGVEVSGVGGDGSAVGGFGGGGLVEDILREGEVVEEVGVVGRLFGEGGEEFEGGVTRTTGALFPTADGVGADVSSSRLRERPA